MPSGIAARARSRQRRAEAQDERLGRLASRGMSGLTTALDVVKAQVARAIIERRPIEPGLEATSAVLAKAGMAAMVASHLLATLDVHLLAGVATNGLRAGGRFGPYDDALEVARKRAKLKKEEEEALARAYGRAAIVVAEDATRSLEKRLRLTMVGIVEDNLHVAEAMERVEATYRAAGLTGPARHQVEGLVRTQIQIAYSAGAVQADRDPAVASILWGYEYSTVGDDRVRPKHVGLDGVTLPKEHPAWGSIMPPNGFNCRCTALRIFREDAPDQVVPMPDVAEVDGVLVKPGPDPGWSFNPGDVFRRAA